jgi:lipopolysaccharide/colanic/teichoic acid biosynthesis glycosyltransferase
VGAHELIKRPIKSSAQGLYHFSAVGPRLRKHRYWREVRSFLGIASLAAILQSVAYVLVMVRANRSDWHNIGAAVLVMSTVPFITGALLSAFRRNESPITTAVLVSLSIFSMAVSALSAMRVPVSYAGFLWCAAIVGAMAAYGNIRYNGQKNASHVAVAPFPGFRTEDGIADLRAIERPESLLSGVETLLIDPVYHHSEPWSGLLARCYLEGVEVTAWHQFVERRLGRLNVGAFDLSHLVYTPSQLIYSRLKRVFDTLFVLVTLPVSLPLSAFVALYIYFRDGNPIIFVQIRRGYGGRRFRMYKFRTMYKKSSLGSAMPNDGRIIRGCAFLRRYRLDELPQLINVLRGEMSLIGPRPVAEDVARRTERAEPKYSFRSLVLPGLTGWAQVTSGYATSTEEEVHKLSHDLYYIKHLSFDLDLLILFKTLRTVIMGAGAR